eukprot:Em0004g1313a
MSKKVLLQWEYDTSRGASGLDLLGQTHFPSSGDVIHSQLLGIRDWRRSLVAAVAYEWKDIIPGAKLAIQEINNRTDILTNYKLELIVADDGCNINWKSIISLINNLYYEGKHIVGIIGPQCSDSAKAVASLTGRSEIALINVHLGSAPELGNRSMYPYSFGMIPSTSNQIDALVALFVRNNWTRAAVLYNPDMLVDYNSFRLFQNTINGKAELSFVSLANPDYLPLVALKNTFVRVIVSFLRGETLGKALCVAYRMGMTYPNYQWLLLGSSPTFPVSFAYNSTMYSCNKTDADKALNQTLQFRSYAYQQYDATSGVSGNTIRFDPSNGYISSVHTYVLNIKWEIVATYTIFDGFQFDPNTAVDFVATVFDETHILVSLPLAVAVIVVDVIGVLLVLGIHVMNTVYRNHKAIKASSSRLNHFAYIGCYLILLAILLYTITETFPVSMQSKSILCNGFPWSLIMGLSLVFEAVTAKTLRTIKKKEFQTRSILVLVYLLTLTTLVGGVIYLIAELVEAGVNTSYGILASLLTVAVYLCIVLFFTPPILLVINGFLHPYRQRLTSRQLTIRTLIRIETAGSQL